MQIDPRLNEITDCLYRVSVKAVVVDGDKVLLVKEDDDDFWSLPGGGVDYGEETLPALRRELTEELGVSDEDIVTDGAVIFVTIGAVLEGIPKANLFYRVFVPVKSIKPTKHVVETGWFTTKEIANLYLSPSTGGTKELISEIRKQLSP